MANLQEESLKDYGNLKILRKFAKTWQNIFSTFFNFLWRN